MLDITVCTITPCQGHACRLSVMGDFQCSYTGTQHFKHYFQINAENYHDYLRRVCTVNTTRGVDMAFLGVLLGEPKWRKMENVEDVFT